MDRAEFCRKYHLDEKLSDEEIKRVMDAIALKKAQRAESGRPVRSPGICVIVTKPKSNK